MKTKPDDYQPTFVDVKEVPHVIRMPFWQQEIKNLPEGKASMLRYNNRQRAHQVRDSIYQSARYYGLKINTRIIHAEPAIHDIDGWLVYFWKRPKEEV